MGQRSRALEGLVTAQKPFWHGKRVLVTGHTGFKGSWLSLWLAQMGAEVQGLALDPPTQPSCFEVARVGAHVASHLGDVRDQETVVRHIRRQKPDVVFHLAAQSLVRESYRNPTATYDTNVMGTVNVLEAIRRTESVRAAIVVTSDKCYENRESHEPYREEDAMGGYDPYSSSKGCAELITAAYRRSFFQPGDSCAARLATARAGNVIGGGDWASERLIPDCFRAIERQETIRIRRPSAVRPWQHVLEPLSGYLILAEKLWNQEKPLRPAYNFGPERDDVQPVAWVVAKLIALWGSGEWMAEPLNDFHEASLLLLDSTVARTELCWRSVLPLTAALEWTVEWFRAYQQGCAMENFSFQQIERYRSLAVSTVQDTRVVGSS